MKINDNNYMLYLYCDTYMYLNDLYNRTSLSEYKVNNIDKQELLKLMYDDDGNSKIANSKINDDFSLFISEAKKLLLSKYKNISENKIHTFIFKNQYQTKIDFIAFDSKKTILIKVFPITISSILKNNIIKNNSESEIIIQENKAIKNIKYIDNVAYSSYIYKKQNEDKNNSIEVKMLVLDKTQINNMYFRVVDLTSIIGEREEFIENKIIEFENRVTHTFNIEEPKETIYCDRCIFKSICIKKEDEVVCEKEIINKDRLNKEIHKLSYPLFFLDFESYSPPYPRFNGETPYSNYVFMFSIIKKEHNNKEDEISYIVPDSIKDYRETLIRKLINALGKQGSIIVYNESFEKSRIKEMIIQYPIYRIELEKINDRIIDLLKILKGNMKGDYNESNYYNSLQNKSYSLKNVIKVFDEDLYKKTSIINGRDASLLFANLNKYDTKEQNIIKKELKEYCGSDTKAMKMILEGIIKKLNNC